MIAIANVLCPVDRSDVSRRALSVAVSLAASHGARLTVLEVVESGLPPLADGSPLYQLTDEARSALLEDLNWFVAPLMSKDVPTDVRLAEGTIVGEVLREAATLQSPIIVMGTHGRGGFERLLLGSVAEKMVRKAACPVLAVPPAGSATGELHRIVCAVDFSPQSERALAFGHLLATPRSVNVSLLHVFEWPFGETTGPDPVTTLRENLEAEARDHLERLTSATHVRVAERVVRRGKPGREIVAFAEEREAELIVLGASGRGAFNQAVLGSTAHYVLRHAPCAVVTVPVES
jgi:nucleotide-binding universal stress UspA family protein